MTMFARAEKGQLNHSNNLTFIKKGTGMTATTSSVSWIEPKNMEIKNIVSGGYTDVTSSFQKQTFISKIGIYDSDRNLIGIAKLATPVLKTEDRNYTFKLKMDI